MPIGQSVSDEEISTACELIAAGGSIAYAAVSVGKSEGTLWNALTSERGTVEYTRAREIRAAAHAQRISITMDKVENGTLQPDQARVILDGAKWLAGRLDGKRWGDKVQQDINATVTTKRASEMSEDELAAIATGAKNG